MEVSETKTFGRMQAGLLGFGTALALLWTVNNRVIPEQDQLFVFEAAQRLLAGDYSDFCGGT